MQKIIFSLTASILLSVEQVRNDGEIKVLTRNGPTTYFIGPHGPTGLEYELLQAFANHLGVKINIVVEDNLETMMDTIANGNAHIAAAGLTITEERKKQVRFTPSYQTITQQVIYRRGNQRPHNIEDLIDGHIEVIAKSSHAEKLNQLKFQFPDLSWDENAEIGSSELLNLVEEEVIDYTIADSNEVSLVRRYLPDVQVAFDLGEPEFIAWAMPKNNDDSLFKAAENFFTKIKNNGELKRLIALHYGHVRKYDYAGTPTYMRHIQGRLPTYQKAFYQAAETNQLDWRLLAAVAYQESHWNPQAVSPTGVRGIMMLTKITAKQLGVRNRTDARQSIGGGARYVRAMYNKFAEIPDPDRIWFALASYNVGYGHVKDAQMLTAKRGGDPEQWTDVKKTLPLLRKRNYAGKQKRIHR
jgi:membrane-bound lytic murein transglycosylase F